MTPAITYAPPSPRCYVAGPAPTLDNARTICITLAPGGGFRVRAMDANANATVTLRSPDDMDGVLRVWGERWA